MNKLTIPQPANWYENNIIACASDNTLVYGTRNSLVVIHPSPPDKPADIKFIPHCHRDRITSVIVNLNWGDPDKLAVSLGDDKIVSVWDINTYKLKQSHNGHQTRPDKIVGITFAGNDKVISVAEDGFIIIWRLGADQLNSLSDILGPKVKVTCISSCPHAPWLTAFGLKRGDIIITDLRKKGRVLYRFKGHDKSVLALSWCPTPFNVFPKNLHKNAKKGKLESQPVLSKQENGTEVLSNENINTVISLENVIDPATQTAFSEDENITNGLNTVTEVCAFKDETKTEIVNTKFAVQNNVIKHETETKTETTATSPLTETENISNSDTINIAISDEIPTYDEKLDQLVTETENISNSDTVNIAVSDEISSCDEKLDQLVTESTGDMEVPVEYYDIQCVTPLDMVCQANIQICKAVPGKVTHVKQNESEGAVEGLLCKVNENGEQQHAVYSNENIIGQDRENHNLLETSASLRNGDEMQHENDENSDSTSKEYLLASSARGGRSIIIWRPATDGVKQIELFVPSNKSRGGHRYEEKSWITISWITPKCILSSSQKGELLMWNLVATKGTYKWRIIHNDHKKHLFSIATPMKLYNSVDDDSFGGNNMLNAWTVGKDRYILNTRLGADCKTLALYPTILGSIYCLTSSPTMPCRIAMGIGEGACRLWDLSLPHLQHIVMNHFSDKLQSKIVSMAWHPVKETVLAYGGIDGRIGIIDPCNCIKLPFVLVQHLHSTVHRLEWGPLNGDCENLGLYAVIGGAVIVYNLDKRNQAPTEWRICSNEFITQMSWKPDYSVCAVVTKSGSLLVLSPKFELLHTIYLQDKVHWIDWHPQATAEDNDISPYASWLAIAGHNVSIYDCSSIEQNYAERVVAVFPNPIAGRYIHCLSWSTFEGGQLAAVSDGVALVWDVKSKTLIHTCIPPNLEILHTVLWSPRDRNYIITGSKEGTLQIWDLSENPPQDKIGKKQKLPKILGASETASNVTADDVIQGIEQSNKGLRRYILEGLASTQNTNFVVDLLEDCKRLFKIHCKDVEVPEPPQETKEDESNRIDVVQLFGNETDLANVLRLERELFYKKRSKTYCADQILLWQGDIGNSIKKAIITKTLDPWLINMAPMVSHNLYREACDAYARQLSESVDSCPFEISSYYLACHRVNEAIEILCEHKKFREALALAKCRLVLTDPSIKKLIERWAKHSELVGHFEVAAQCYIVLNQLDKAAKLLFRRNNIPTLEFCAEMAERCNKNLLDAILFKLDTLKNPSHPEIPLPTRIDLEIELNEENGGLDEICREHVTHDCDFEQDETKCEIDTAGENSCHVTLGDGLCIATKTDDSNSDDGEKINQGNNDEQVH